MNQQKHTIFASQAVGLAELFKFTIGKQRLEGPVTYIPELSAPDGPSTAGGKQALQHLKLVPEGGGAGTMVIGTANMVEKTAELRSHAHVSEMHRQRFKGAEWDIMENKYDTLLEQIRAFFADKGYRVRFAEPPAPRPVAAAAPEPSSSRFSAGLVVGVAVGAAVLAGAVMMLLRG